MTSHIHTLVGIAAVTVLTACGGGDDSTANAPATEPATRTVAETTTPKSAASNGGETPPAQSTSQGELLLADEPFVADASVDCSGSNGETADDSTCARSQPRALLKTSGSVRLPSSSASSSSQQAATVTFAAAQNGTIVYRGESSVGPAPAQTENFAITSDPQFLCTENCGVDAETSRRNIDEQYRGFNREADKLAGIIINGDLTEFGHLGEWKTMEDYLSTLKVPYYFGLGNHDYQNNLNDCYQNNCAVRSIVRLIDHVKAIDKPHSMDVSYSQGYEFPTIRVRASGSLGYSVDYPKTKIIQLNDMGFQGEPDYHIDSYIDAYADLLPKRYVIDITNSDRGFAWLENQLIEARRAGKVIILNAHFAQDKVDGTVDFSGNIERNHTRLIALLDKYQVKLRFHGHLHAMLGMYANYQHAGFMYSGSSARGTHLRLEIDHAGKAAKVYTVSSVNATPVLDQQFDLAYTGPVPAPVKAPVLIRVKNEGGYVSYVSVTYKDKNGVPQSVRSPNLKLGNVWSFMTPAGATDIGFESRDYTGLAWDRERLIVKRQDVSQDTCIKTWGTTLAPKWGSVSCMN